MSWPRRVCFVSVFYGHGGYSRVCDELGYLDPRLILIRIMSRLSEEMVPAKST